MNETVFEYCKALRLEQTRSRAYKKNDQAWVEQKNGAVVRRLVGYGRLSGLAETQALAELYAVSRLYINFFQPSFKLKSKTCDGARVYKKYYAPMTPSDRLLGSPHVAEAAKAKLREQFTALDPVKLLQGIRVAQQVLANHASGSHNPAPPESPVSDIATFLSSLSTAWRSGEVRPTHRKQGGTTRSWRTRADPFEHTWPVMERWLATDASVTAKDMLARLVVMVPDAYIGKAQLRTLQRRVKQWRAAQAKNLILGHLSRSGDREGAASATPSLSIREEATLPPGNIPS